jgi:hypothetical protein
MPKCDYRAPWYHGSPEKLTVLLQGSWVTQFQEMAKAFAHKPSLLSFGDDGQRVKHDGQLPGFLYRIAGTVRPEDVSYLRDTAGTHWQTQRDLPIELVAELPVSDPPLLTDGEIAALRQAIPEGTTGFIGTPDPE